MKTGLPLDLIARSLGDWADRLEMARRTQDWYQVEHVERNVRHVQIVLTHIDERLNPGERK